MSFLQLVFSLDKTIEGNNSNVTLTRNSILENVKLTDITTTFIINEMLSVFIRHNLSISSCSCFMAFNH